MNSPDEWHIPPRFQPDQDAVDYDLETALAAVVSLRAKVPDDAFTAETLGTERIGQGVLIRAPDLVLTIGYLVTEAEEVWLTTGTGRAVPAYPLAYDFVTGFGLVQALAPLDIPALGLGDSRRLAPGESVVVAAAGGRSGALAAQVVARQEFAGYWEYLIEDAFFTAPAHPRWSGAAMIDSRGRLVGIGSLQLQHEATDARVIPLNMLVPIDLLKPILDDLLTRGRADRPTRPWLGVYSGEADNEVMIIGLAADGPARRAGLRPGDVVRAVAGEPMRSLRRFYRAVWSLGDAGVDVPLTLEREGDVFDVRITSASRDQFLKRSPLH
jgi:S1-C subfamily serine protease